MEGVSLSSGAKVKGKQVVLTTGTFLRGMIYVGDKKYQAGRHCRDSDEV